MRSVKSGAHGVGHGYLELNCNPSFCLRQSTFPAVTLDISDVVTFVPVAALIWHQGCFLARKEIAK